MQPRFGIRTKLLLSILAILLVSYATLLYSTMSTLSTVSRTEIEKNLDANLRHVRADYLNRSEMVTYSLLHPLSSTHLQERLSQGDRRWLNEQVKRWHGVLPYLELMVLLDPQKKVIAGLGATGDGKAAFPAVVDQALATRQVSVSTELVPASLFSDRSKQRAVQGELLMMTVVMPIHGDDGRLLGCLVTGEVLNKNTAFPDALKRFFGSDLEIAITQHGEMIASSYPSDGVSSPPLSVKALELLRRGEPYRGQLEIRGRSYETAVDPLLNSRGEMVGSLIVALSAERFEAMRNVNLSNIVVSAILGILLSFAMAYAASRQLTGPLRQLAKGARRIEEGDLNQRVEGHQSDEVGMLAASFNKMAGALKERDRIINMKTHDLQELNEQLEKKVTERTHALSMEMGRLEAVLTSMAEGVLVTDANNRVVLFNPAAQKMFELVPYLAVGQPIEDVCEMGGFSRLLGRIKEIGSPSASGAREELEVKGKRLWVHLSSLQDGAGLYAGVVLSIRDVTVEEEVDRMKTEFISTVSHELKTPLTSMMGSLQLLLTRGKWLTDTERQLLTVCLRNTQRLIRLISEILDISGIESGGMAFKFKPISIGEVAHYAVEEIRSLAMGRNIAIVNSVGEHLPLVLGDRDRLIQVITNLLSNAVKFSPEGKVVMVSAEHEGNYVTLSVADRGNVIKRADREKLFKKFQQIESSNQQKVSGTGLGLAICKEIVERHQGKIYYTADKERGNTFSFTVPMIGEEHGKG